MDLRPGRHADLVPLRRVAEGAFWETYSGLLKPDTIGRMLAGEWSPSAVARRLLRGGVLVAADEGDLVGFADTVDAGGALEVAAIATSPQRRRRGYGRALLERAATAHPGLALRVDVLLGNLDAEGFFERLGFVPVEVMASERYEEDVVARRWWREPAEAQR